MKKLRIFVKGNSYLETPIKAAFLNILGLIEYNLDKSNIDKAIAIFDEALKLDPQICFSYRKQKRSTCSKRRKNSPAKK